VHRVTFASPFAMGRYEVTVAEFGMFVKATGYRTDAERSGEGCWHVVLAKGKLRDKPTEDASWRNPYIDQTGVHPVVCVSWNDAQAYVKWLSKETGKRYRLPTEAEWEYAARANTKTVYWWGDDFKDNRANCRFCGSGWDFLKGTAPVGSFPANPFGLSDTAGNVWEWVQDCMHQSYKGAPEDGRAWGEEDSGECGWRGDRGSSWGNSRGTLRSAFRGWDYRPHHLIGFRLAQDL
jgi:formylglycine-generating enzyme required for sulfatase activity